MAVAGKKYEEKPNLLMVVYKIVVALTMIAMFIPAANPGRISEVLNKNQSLFTLVTSYNNLKSNYIRAIEKEWIAESSLKLLYFSSVVFLAGTIVILVGWCMSFGEGKMKRDSIFFIIGGDAVLFIGTVMSREAYKQFSLTSKPTKILPIFPSGIYVYYVLIVLVLILSCATLIMLPKHYENKKYEMQSKYKLFLLILPFVVLCILFSYLPLWGWRYAFFDYKPGFALTKDSFVGFKWFKFLFENDSTKQDVIKVLKNTLGMSFLGIATSWFAMAFAIFLTEIRGPRKKKLIQTFTTLPNFISWVLVYSVAFAMFSTDGFLNAFLQDLGVSNSSTNYLMNADHMWLKMLAWGIWKGLGWSAIIYIAAISGIDQELYEAATVDGAGRFRKMWHITMPGLIPTYCVLLLLSIAGILSNGMDQYLVFKNAMNEQDVKVLDLYVYLIGLGKGSNIPLATVVGMVKSLVSVILLFGANAVSKLVRGQSII